MTFIFIFRGNQQKQGWSGPLNKKLNWHGLIRIFIAMTNNLLWYHFAQWIKVTSPGCLVLMINNNKIKVLAHIRIWEDLLWNQEYIIIIEREREGIYTFDEIQYWFHSSLPKDHLYETYSVVRWVATSHKVMALLHNVISMMQTASNSCKTLIGVHEVYNNYYMLQNN